MKINILTLSACCLVFLVAEMKAQVTSYTFVPSMDTFTEITVAGGAVQPAFSSGNIDEGYYNNIPIGFTFNFYDSLYTTAAASTNGFLKLGGNITEASSYNHLNTGDERPCLAPFWDDLMFNNSGGKFRYQTSGTPGERIFVAQWLLSMVKVNYWYESTLSFQVRLYEADNTISFIYRQDVNASPYGSASIGIAKCNEGSGNFLSLNWNGLEPFVSSTIEMNTIDSLPLTGQVFSFLVDSFPEVALNPVPGNFDLISPDTLFWSDGGGNATRFKVFLDTAYPPQMLVADTSLLYYPAENLLPNTTYFWKIVPHNNNGSALNCPVWRFTTPDFCIFGQVSYTNAKASPLANIPVFLKDQAGAILDTCLTESLGMYRFPLAVGGHYSIGTQISMPTGGYNAVDAVLALKHVVGMDILSGINLRAARVRYPNVVTAVDAMFITRRFTGSLPSFPMGDWTAEEKEVIVVPDSSYALDIKSLCLGDVNGSYQPASVSGPPCAGVPYVLYGGKLYHTVQFGSQCWMRENLNIGTMKSGGQTPTNNGIIEKFCYNNDSVNCGIYGGMYYWNELMQYTTNEGSQGICPTGWHVPSYNELTLLVTAAGGPFSGWSALSEAGNAHWSAPNTATNSTGFTALPGGYQWYTGNSFYQLHHEFYLWSSTQTSTTQAISFVIENPINNLYWEKTCGLSVRCIRD